MWEKGSLTVEIALLMPLILLVWMGTVSACLFVHNRAWMTAAAYEAAVTGSWDAVCSEGDVESRAWEKIKILQQTPVYGSKDIRTSLACEKDILSVSIEGGHAVYGGLRWGFHVTGSRKLCRPVSFIRRAKVLREAAGQMGGG